jgi:hypothetical protein
MAKMIDRPRDAPQRIYPESALSVAPHRANLEHLDLVNPGAGRCPAGEPE